MITAVERIVEKNCSKTLDQVSSGHIYGRANSRTLYGVYQLKCLDGLRCTNDFDVMSRSPVSSLEADA
jgi:hypothetical protein